MKIDFKKLVIVLGITFAVAFLGSAVTTPSIDGWYAGLNKPFFNPPNWLFAPVWTTLFVLMGIAAYLIWKNGENNQDVKRAIKFYFSQLVFNFLWSFIFFYLHLPLIAFIDIVILWVLIFLTIKNFKKISASAAYLLYPYLIWVSFASILNLAIIVLN